MADINDWMRGNGTDVQRGQTNASLIDDTLTNYLQDPLDRLLDNYRRGCIVRYGSTHTVIVGLGELTLENSAGDQHRMRANPTTELTLTLPSVGNSGDELDTGNAQADQQYYVYAVADADATTYTGIISESDTFPTGVSYAKRIGYFYNQDDGGGDGEIVSVGNEGSGAGNIGWEIGTDDVTIPGAAAYYDLDDMIIYYVASGTRPVKVTFMAPFNHSAGGGATGWCDIYIDSAAKVETKMTFAAGANNPEQACLQYAEILSAGTHTIKVRWKVTGGTMYQDGATDGDRVLIVEEI